MPAGACRTYCRMPMPWLFCTPHTPFHTTFRLPSAGIDIAAAASEHSFKITHQEHQEKRCAMRDILKLSWWRECSAE